MLKSERAKYVSSILLLGWVLALAVGCSESSSDAKQAPGASSGSGAAAGMDQVQGLIIKLDAQELEKLEALVKSYPTKAAEIKNAISSQKSVSDQTTERIHQLNDQIPQIAKDKEELKTTRDALYLKMAYIEKQMRPMMNKQSQEEMRQHAVVAKGKEAAELKNKISKLSNIDLMIDVYWHRKDGMVAKKEALEKEIKKDSAPVVVDREALRLVSNQKQQWSELDEQVKANLSQQTQLDQKVKDIQAEIVKLQEMKSSTDEEVAAARTELEKSAGKLEQQYKTNALSLYREYSRTSAVDMKKVVAVLTDLNLLEGSKRNQIADLETVPEKILQISKRAAEGKTATAGDFKLAVEDSLARLFHNNTELIYNSDSALLTDVVLNNRMQCYSGTSLFLILNKMRQSPFKNMVVIFKNGHVLPGYVESKNGQNVLMGVETTATGKAIIDFGVTSKVAGDIRVFDANHFMLFEALRPLKIANFAEVYKQMLAATKKWGFNPDKFKAVAQDGGGARTAIAPLNETPLAFGSLDVPAGDLKREKFDTRKETPSAAGGAVGHTLGNTSSQSVGMMDFDRPTVTRVSALVKDMIKASGFTLREDGVDFEGKPSDVNQEKAEQAMHRMCNATLDMPSNGVSMTIESNKAFKIEVTSQGYLKVTILYSEKLGQQSKLGGAIINCEDRSAEEFKR